MFCAAPPPQKASIPKGWECRKGQSSWGRVSGFAHLFADLYLDRAAEREWAETQFSACKLHADITVLGSGRFPPRWVRSCPQGTGSFPVHGDRHWVHIQVPGDGSGLLEPEGGGGQSTHLSISRDIYPQGIPLTGATRSKFLSVLW